MGAVVGVLISEVVYMVGVQPETLFRVASCVLHGSRVLLRSIADVSDRSHLLVRIKMPPTNTLFAVSAAISCALAQQVPATAQVVDQKIFNVLENVPPPSVANDSTVCHLPHPILTTSLPEIPNK